MRVVVAGAHGQVARRLGRLLSGRGDTVVGIVRNAGHAADLTVDEKGTEAAAATVVGVTVKSRRRPPPDAVTFNANRPFLFFLRDTRTGTVLFAGRLAKPTPP